MKYTRKKKEQKEKRKEKNKKKKKSKDSLGFCRLRFNKWCR